MGKHRVFDIMPDPEEGLEHMQEWHTVDASDMQALYLGKYIYLPVGEDEYQVYLSYLQPEKPESNPVRILSVNNCARCGENHTSMIFRRFTRAVEDEDGTAWKWWSLCPTTNEPVLMRDLEVLNE